MSSHFRPGMAEATRLTREGKLGEATALIQRLLRGEDATAPAEAPWIEADYTRVERPAPPRTGLRETLRRLREQGWAPGAERAPRPAPAPIPDGARFEMRRFAGAADGRDYMLYVPANRPAGPMPLIVMLHGCTQTAEDFAAGTGMNAAAEAAGCLVAYPEQPASANGKRCWNWFRPQDQGRSGEPALVAGIVREVVAAEGADPARVYVAGLSAGGAAAAVLGAAYPELFAAVGVHSGLPAGAAHDLPSALAAMRGGAGGANGTRRAADHRLPRRPGHAGQPGERRGGGAPPPAGGRGGWSAGGRTAGSPSAASSSPTPPAGRSASTGRCTAAGTPGRAAAPAAATPTRAGRTRPGRCCASSSRSAAARPKLAARRQRRRRVADRGGIFAGEDPFAIARAWLAEAEGREPNDANAVALATVDEGGLPNVRMVLLKEIEAGAFVFYTNYESAKARELDGAGKAAFVMHWKSLRRQVRARGAVAREEGPQADAYFRSRSLQSRLGAWASRQSQPLASRAALMAAVARVAATQGARPGAAAVLGRLPPRPGRDRVLGGRRAPAARPLPLDPRRARGRLADSPAQPVSIAASPALDPGRPRERDKGGEAGAGRAVRKERRMRAPVVIVLIALFTLIGDYFLKLAAEREQSFRSAVFIFGTLIYGSTAVGWVLVMKHMTLASIGVWYAIIVILLLTALGVFVFGESFTWRDGVGILLAFGALAMMSRFA